MGVIQLGRSISGNADILVGKSWLPTRMSAFPTEMDYTEMK